VQASELNSLLNQRDVAIVDLREDRERSKQGEIPGSLHVPYASITDALKPGGVLRELGTTKSLLFYCAFGERSAMAVQLAQEAGLKSGRHLHGGFSAWCKEDDHTPRASSAG
jgi:rhodanese-related sulfurtransferase